MLSSKPMTLALACCSVLAITHKSATAQSPAGQTERPIVYPSAAIANYQATPLNEVLRSVNVIEAAEIEQSTATTVSDLIAQKTGIELSRTGGPGSQTSIFLRGQKSANYVLLVDGIRVHGDTYSNVIMPELSISQIEKIEVLKGNASALYGEAAIGGVINIITKSASLRDSGFISIKYGRYDTSEVSAGISKYINGFNLSFTGSNFETEGYDVQSASNTNPDKDGYQQDSYNFTLAKRLSATTKLTIGSRNRESEGAYDSTWNVPSGNHEYNNENREQFVTYELKKGGLLNLRLDYNQAERNRKELINNAQDSAIDSETNTLKLVNISSLQNKNFLHSIIQGLEFTDSYHDDDGSRSERDIEAVFLGYGAAYGTHSMQTNLRRDKVSLKTTAGAHAYMKETSYLVGYGYEFADYYKMAISHATGFRAPSAGAYGSNTDLKPETYSSNELSVQRDKDGRLLRLTAFSTKSKNEIRWLSVAPWTPQNIAKNENTGLEISYSGSARIVDFDLDATFQNPREEDTTTSAGDSQSLKRAKAYGKLNLSRQLGDYRIGGVLIYSGRKYDSGSKIIASFTRIDGYISRQLTSSVSINLKAENITNTEYETTAGYRTPERSLFLTLKYDFISGL